MYWMEHVIKNNITAKSEFKDLFQEAADLVTNLVALIHKTKNKAA